MPRIIALFFACTLAGCGGGSSGGALIVSMPTPGSTLATSPATTSPASGTPTAGATSTPIAAGGHATASPKPAVSASASTPTPPAVSQTATPSPGATVGATSQIKHIVVLIQENRTFDNIFHGFTEPSGAIADYAEFAYDKAGNKIPLMSSTIEGTSTGGNGHADFLADYDGGKMDGFYDNNGAGATLPASAEKNFQVSYVQQAEVQPYWDLATQGSLAQRFFHGLTGGTEPSHMIFAAGTSTWNGNPDQRITENASGLFGCGDPNHPTDVFATLDRDGTLGPKVDSCLKGVKTIEELIDEAGHTWRWYSGPVGGPVNGMPGVATDIGGLLNPMQDYTQIYNGPAFSNVIYPETRILADVAAGTLADVTFVTPDGANSDHPDIAAATGPSWVASVVNAIGASPLYDSTAVFVTWDDWGGFYDHVPPPQKYAPYGLGFRIPLICISPFAKHGQLVDTQLEPGSVLKYIEDNFGLGSLGTEDSTSNSASAMLDTTQPAVPYKTVAARYRRNYFLSNAPSYAVLDPDEYGPGHSVTSRATPRSSRR